MKEQEHFKLENTSLWSFPERGDWANHNGSYRGNWSPYIPRNLILRYTNKGDIILDQFLGSGTTLVEAKLLERRAIGIDVNIDSLKLAQKNISFINSDNEAIRIFRGDARNLYFIKDSSIDFICTHPPYADAIKYSNNINNDLSRLDYNSFIKEMNFVADEAHRLLKDNKFCAIMIGDIRKKGNVVPLGFMLLQIFINTGFKLKEIIIKEQHNCKETEKWLDIAKNRNFLLLKHEYIFVFYKQENS